MILHRWITQGNFFARNKLTDLLPLPNHDENITPGDSTDVYLNYKWRVFIVASLVLLEEYNQSLLSDAELDEFSRTFDNMIIDFYNLS